MKTNTLFSALAIALAALVCACTTPAPRFQAGVSAAAINPPAGAFIAGDRQNRVFTGVHDSLFAKAFVVNDGQSEIAIVTLDCIGLLYPDVCRIREKAAALCGFPQERVIVSSTHTHSGPDVVGIWGADYAHSGVDSVYMDFLVQTAATRIQQAVNNKKNAVAVVAQTTFGEPWVQNICQEELDRSVAILQFRDETGAPIATLTNFACHPTFMDATCSEVSADYINGYYQTLQASGGGEALFLQGAIGGWVQPEGEAGTFENAFRRGRELAETVQAALKQARPLAEGGIRFNSKQLRFPVENEAWKQLSEIGTIHRAIQDSVLTEIAWFSIGDAQFVTHPGETAPYYALETKKLLPQGPAFVLGLCNDALGYILKPVYFEDKTLPHAEYLTRTSVGKPTGPLLMEHIKTIIPPR